MFPTLSVVVQTSVHLSSRPQAANASLNPVVMFHTWNFSLIMWKSDLCRTRLSSRTSLFCISVILMTALFQLVSFIFHTAREWQLQENITCHLSRDRITFWKLSLVTVLTGIMSFVRWKSYCISDFCLQFETSSMWCNTGKIIRNSSWLWMLFRSGFALIIQRSVLLI